MLVALAANVIAVFATSYMYPRAGGQLYLIWRCGEPAWLRWALLLAVAFMAYRIVAGRAKIPAYQAALARWHKTWIRKRYGTMFVPE